uniref:Uncharacterized protein n=1 Tax=Romanomermis culicivorax TaxID=13658 RepID=A0A915KTL1_ROMCU
MTSMLALFFLATTHENDQITIMKNLQDGVPNINVACYMQIRAIHFFVLGPKMCDKTVLLVPKTRITADQSSDPDPWKIRLKPRFLTDRVLIYTYKSLFEITGCLRLWDVRVEVTGHNR